jgi:hypothetical protein
LQELLGIARRYADRCDVGKIPSTATWNARVAARIGRAAAAPQGVGNRS